METKVFIIVEDGLVQQILSSDPNIYFTVVDYDNPEDERAELVVDDSFHDMAF